ncbi:DNA mismatch repair endonuclease MutL [Mangrovibacter plantisponsor]|uniref:DNA mismatch repair protein MutL n=1 Tax=Mangrovibacter plantisponsor TaxID=451513 RepID=A0A317PKA2_9ENTR|nr:DNA mismatch repair endonuclease MutL [Mangrovibacter plantisponsor]PWW01072.1 DNA mismatch repair protein MutL [Mangrovibacter plantisponsor]
MPIQVLPPQLANQIAAGEVVERPASVVKELVENSLDAGATRIDIDIERGGAKLIRIRDNGSGIGKDELALALSRHATSKIASLDDLEAIMSLGFRGEALASISSVSRLTLTSRTADQQEAWQAYAEGREMAVTVKPAAHPQGTTLEVLDLFYNTPARRKFMRTEKTEFAHIDEIIRRIALARFDVTINLSHNGKMVRQYRAVKEGSQEERRLGAICGTAFMEHALAIEWQHGDLGLKGWVVAPDSHHPANADIQYSYVNGRMMRDKLINHAIRQACEDRLGQDQLPAYVLYLTVDPHQVDVNVHPAKHEVRFHQSRLVHDFIYQGVLSVFQQYQENPLGLNGALADAPAASAWQPENRTAAGENQFTRSPSAPENRAASLHEPPDKHYTAPQFSERPSGGTSSARLSGAEHYSGGAGSSGGRSASDTGHSGSGGQAAHNSWPNAVPGYQKKQGALYQKLLETPQALAATEQPAEAAAGDHILSAREQSLGRALAVVAPDMVLLERRSGICLMALPVAQRWLRRAQLMPGQEKACAQPLLIPVRLKLDAGERATLKQQQETLQNLGIILDIDAQFVTVRAVPLPLRQQNLQNLIPDLIGYLAGQKECDAAQIAHWLAGKLESEPHEWSLSQAITLLTELERLCPQLVMSPPGGLLQPIDLKPAISALKHD